MARIKAMGVSPITNKIYYGTLNTEKQMWVSNKTDVTIKVISYTRPLRSVAHN